MQKWEKLKSGDIVDIIAPGYAASSETLLAVEKFLRSQGLVPRIPKDLMVPTHFHSNSDEVRFQHFKKAILAKDSRAVWCLRGGYGSNRLLPMIAKLKKPKISKIFIGISDVTSLHVFLNQKWKWCTLHAALLDRMASGRLPQELLSETLAIVTGAETEVRFSGLVPLNAKAQKIKNIKASIVGGNLTTIQSSIGTPWALKAKDHFLFLEDIGERGYRVDRMLEHLKQAGSLNGCKGLLLGQWLGGEEVGKDGAREKSRVMEALERFAKSNPSLPVWSGVESGHDVRLRALPFGTEASIQSKGGDIVLSVKTGCR